MKKLRLVAVVAMLAIVTVASAQMNLGIKGGLNMSNMVGDEINDNNMKLGFHVGLAVDYNFTPSMAIQTGLFFTTKGMKSEGSFLGITGSSTTNLMYLQLPVHFAYKQEVTPETRIIFHAGPYVAYGVAGKITAEVEGLKVADSDKVFGDGVTQLKPFDAGLGLGVGAEFGRFLVDIGWDMGLVNLANTDNAQIRNQIAYFSVGFKF